MLQQARTDYKQPSFWAIGLDIPVFQLPVCPTKEIHKPPTGVKGALPTLIQ